MDEKVRKQLESCLLPLHVQEIQFILFCRKLQFGTIEKLAIQNGLPAAAVNVAERIDFTKGEGFQRVRVLAEEAEVQEAEDEARDSHRHRRRSD